MATIARDSLSETSKRTDRPIHETDFQQESEIRMVLRIVHQSLLTAKEAPNAQHK